MAMRLQLTVNGTSPHDHCAVVDLNGTGMTAADPTGHQHQIVNYQVYPTDHTHQFSRVTPSNALVPCHHSGPSSSKPCNCGRK